MKENGIYGETEGLSAAAERSVFIRKTYLNLALAFAVFIAVEWWLMQWSGAVELAAKMTAGGANWLLVLGAFMVVSWVANSWAATAENIGKQYAGLFLYVVAEAVIFLPLMLLADAIAPDVIPQAAVMTAALAGGVSAYAFWSGRDFSFIGAFLTIVSFVALGIIVCAMIFGFGLGLWFSGAMILFSAFVVLYQTSAIIHRFDSNQYVAAALGLFAAIALMFWYIVSFLLNNSRR